MNKISFPVNSREPPVSDSPALGFQVYTTVPGFFRRFWGSSSGPYAYTSGTLPTEPTPQPHVTPVLKSSCLILAQSIIFHSFGLLKEILL